MKEVSPSQVRRIMNSTPRFNLITFKESQDKQSYVTSLLVQMFIKHQIKDEMCNLTQITIILKELTFDLTLQQRHQIFLFSLQNQKYSSKRKLFNIINQQRKKVNIQSMVQWICSNIDKLKFKQHNIIKNKPQFKRRSISEIKPATKLPTLNKKSKLEQKLKPLIGIFNTMKRLRQENGLIPYSFDEDNDLDNEFMHIPYDPTMSQLHIELSQLKLQAEDHLKQIIQLARDNPKIKTQLQQGVHRFQKLRLQTNQRIGRAGAVNAQKRLAERRKRQLQRLRSVRLQSSDDMIRASNVYRLLNDPITKRKSVLS